MAIRNEKNKTEWTLLGQSTVWIEFQNQYIHILSHQKVSKIIKHQIKEWVDDIDFHLKYYV